MESTQPVLRCRYSYDPLDHLISQLQPDAPAHQRFYCKSRLATEIQGSIGFSVFQNNDLLLAQHKNQGGAVESTLLATDLQRSVLHTLTGDQQQHPIAYSPYGHRQAESGLTSLLGFNGERPDPVTGHYLLGNGYRAFNPVLMRFNRPDSWSPFGKGGLNPYAYCLGDPVNFGDPTGRSRWSDLISRLKTAGLMAPKALPKANSANAVKRKLPETMLYNWGMPHREVVNAPLRRSKSMSLIPEKNQKEFNFNDLVGYHGSTVANTDSLHAGINPEKILNGFYGKGFYSTPTYERTVHYGRGSSPSKRFGVYVENQKALKEGRDYTFHKSPDSFWHGDYLELVIKQPAYHLVTIRAIDIRGKVVMPKPHEAHF
jgi:RHS repeat-associated protein